MVWSGGDQSPAAGGDKQGNAGKAWLAQPSRGRNQSSPLEPCSQPDLVTEISGSRSPWERAGDGEGARSRAGSTTVEGRDRVLAPWGRGTPGSLYTRRGWVSGTQRARKGQGWSTRSGWEPGSRRPWVWWETGSSTHRPGWGQAVSTHLLGKGQAAGTGGLDGGLC